MFEALFELTKIITRYVNVIGLSASRFWQKYDHARVMPVKMDSARYFRAWKKVNRGTISVWTRLFNRYRDAQILLSLGLIGPAPIKVLTAVCRLSLVFGFRLTAPVRA